MFYKKLRFLFFIISLFAFAAHGFAQDSGLAFRFGGGVSAGLAQGKGSFKEFPFAPMPAGAPNFASANGLGLSFYAFSNAIITQFFSAGILVDYFHSSVSFSSTEAITVIQNGKPMDAFVNHRIETSLPSFGIAPTMTLRVAGSLGIMLGTRIGFYTATSYSQTQMLDGNPSGIRFISEAPHRQGPITGLANASVSLIGSLQYPIAIFPNGNVHLLPELSVRYGLTDVIRGVGWKEFSVNFGIGILLTQLPDHPLVLDTLIERDTSIKIVQGLLSERVVHIDADTYTYDRNKENAVVRTFVIRERYRHELPKPLPLLSGNLSIRFITDKGRESDTASLLLEQAKVLRTGSKSRPSDTIETVSDLPAFRIYPRVVSEAGIESWNITLENGGIIIASASGKGKLPGVIEFDSIRSILPEHKILYSLTIVDEEGNSRVGFSGALHMRSDTSVIHSRSERSIRYFTFTLSASAAEIKKTFSEFLTRERGDHTYAQITLPSEIDKKSENEIADALKPFALVSKIIHYSSSAAENKVFLIATTYNGSGK